MRRMLYILAVVLSTSDAQFCSHPNVPDSYFNPRFNDVVQTVPGVTYIITLPSVPCNCSSTVTGIQYCYNSVSPGVSMENVFEFLSVTRDDLLFTIDERFTLQTAIRTIRNCTCRDMLCNCCDTYTVPQREQFQVPSTFGVRTTNTDGRLLATTSLPLHSDVEQFQTTVTEGNALLGAGGQVTNMPDILLLRFMTRKCILLYLSILIAPQHYYEYYCDMYTAYPQNNNNNNNKNKPEFSPPKPQPSKPSP